MAEPVGFVMHTSKLVFRFNFNVQFSRHLDRIKLSYFDPISDYFFDFIL